MSGLKQSGELRARHAVTGLQWVLAIVILIEAGGFVLAPSARHEFDRTHMPQILRLLLGWGEIIGSILLLIPRTAVRGSWLLLVVFLVAILLHLLHGMPNVGALVIYSAAAWAIAFGKGTQEHFQ
jgi:uncharacterized membrane protein YphA (DoxX/SURF4 family)